MLQLNSRNFRVEEWLFDSRTCLIINSFYLNHITNSQYGIISILKYDRNCALKPIAYNVAETNSRMKFENVGFGLGSVSAAFLPSYPLFHRFQIRVTLSLNYGSSEILRESATALVSQVA